MSTIYINDPENQQQRFTYHIQWKVLGPLPVEEFLNEFFPRPSDSSDVKTLLENAGVDYRGINFASVPDSPKVEEEMYEGLCSNLNEIAKTRKLTFRDASGNVERLKPGTIKPDIGLFHIGDENKGYMFNIKKTHGDQPSYVARMGLVYLFIEVNRRADQDIFTDPPDDPPSSYKFTVDTWNSEDELKDRISTLEEIAHYVRVVQSRQFRTCVFSLTISGSTARIMRWDSPGVLVTRSFDYKVNPDVLIEFIWRFVNANQDQQGFDSTATAVDSKEHRDSFLRVVRSHVELQLALGPETPEDKLDAEVNRHYDSGVLTRLAIEDRKFWVCRPLWVSRAIVGRCTVAYWGVDCDSKEVVFVKDVWRTNVEGVEMEGDILKRLREKEVGFIPSLVCHGDLTVGETLQTTHTDRFADEPWVKSRHNNQPQFQKITPRIHYRLVTNNAGYPLSSFKGSRELLCATYDAFTAVMDAKAKAETLHRDVGLPNIILYRPGKGVTRVGFLVDWELAIRSGSEEARSRGFIGTPAFMSIDAMNLRNHVHSLEDDIESFIYVVLYAALRWLPVGSSVRGFNWWFRDFFGAPTPDGHGGGRPCKYLNAKSRDYTAGLDSAKSPQVMQWLNDAMDLHYKDKLPNPAWEGGKALKEMWEKCLEGELPDDDRCVNSVPGMKFNEGHALHATYTAGISSTGSYAHDKQSQLPKTIPTKRSQDAGDVELTAASPPRKTLRSL